MNVDVVAEWTPLDDREAAVEDVGDPSEEAAAVDPRISSNDGDEGSSLAKKTSIHPPYPHDCLFFL